MAQVTVFNLNELDKKQLCKAARALGYKGDFEGKVSKADLIEMIQSETEENQEGALRAIGADDEDIATLRCDTTVSNDEDEDETELLAAVAKKQPAAPVQQKESAMQATTTMTPDVQQTANMLAQLLAAPRTATVDAEQVAAIVDGKLADVVDQVGVLMGSMQNNIVGIAEKMIADAVGSIAPRKIEITSKTGTFMVSGVQHAQFEELLTVVAARGDDGDADMNVWLAGPAGSGKTTAAANVAKALGMQFYTNGSIASKHELTGFMDANGKLVRTPFRDAWELGGVYLFDEIDGSDPRALLAFNAALANGIMAFPDGMLKRHADCVVIAAANTFGQGATAEFVGRAKQDAASLDRFVFIDWILDESLELALCANKDWAKFVQKIRRNVQSKGMKVLITPRATFKGARLLESGLSKDRVIAMTLKKGMSNDQWQMIAA